MYMALVIHGKFASLSVCRCVSPSVRRPSVCLPACPWLALQVVFRCIWMSTTFQSILSLYTVSLLLYYFDNKYASMQNIQLECIIPFL